jgi:hypothetical protein
MKLVVGPGGQKTYVELTPEEEAQRVIDEQKHLENVAAREVEDTRIATFTDDTDRQEFLANLATMTAAEIKTFVRTRIDATGVSDLASAKACMVRLETAVAILLTMLVKR